MRMRTIKTDVAIMGSGLAGLSAALVAQEHGMKVAVFEKRPFQGGGVSNTPMQTMAIRDDPAYQDKAFKIHMDYTRWNANPHVVRAWLQNSTRIPGFIRSLGIDFLNIKYNPLEELGTTRGYEVGFPNAVHIGDYYRFKAIGKGHGGAVICKKASDKIKAQGGEVYFSMPIQSLIKENGKVVGAWALDRKTGEQVRIEAGAVVVASGGFNDNKEYIEKYCDLTLTDKNCSGDGNVVFNNFTGSQLTGDGQTAVWEIGGDKGAMGVSGHNMVPGPGIVGNNCAWVVYNQLRTVQEQAYLWVNQRGKRFICEEMSDEHEAMVTAIKNQPGKCAYIIFDEDTRIHMEKDGVERAYFIFEANTLNNVEKQFRDCIAKGNRHVFVAETIEELCEQTGIELEGLQEQLAVYNASCDKGYDEELGKARLFMKPVRRGKFYAMRVYPGGYHAFGGIKIDGKCRVLDTDQRPIPGLYAGGDCCAGEVFGDPPIGGIGWSTLSFSEGFICGDEASAYVKEAVL